MPALSNLRSDYPLNLMSAEAPSEDRYRFGTSACVAPIHPALGSSDHGYALLCASALVLPVWNDVTIVVRFSRPTYTLNILRWPRPADVGRCLHWVPVRSPMLRSVPATRLWVFVQPLNSLPNWGRTRIVRSISSRLAVAFGNADLAQTLLVSVKIARPCAQSESSRRCTCGAVEPSFENQTEQARSHRKEHIMLQSRGPVSFHPLFTAEDIGLRKGLSVEHAIKVFLYIGEAVASRWIEMPKGVLLLQAVPDNPRSGAIYLYDRERQIFFFLAFRDGRDDSLTVAEFEQLVTEYDLVSRAANPALLSAAVTKPATA